MARLSLPNRLPPPELAEEPRRLRILPRTVLPNPVLPSFLARKRPAPPPSLQIRPLAPGSPWPSGRIQFLVERDGAYCWICNGEVRPEDVSLERGSAPQCYEPTVDHVRPKVQGGGNERTNLRLAHYFCNNIRTSETPHEGWRRVRSFALRRDPDLVRYNEAPARTATMPPPTKPIPAHHLSAMTKMLEQQATAESRRVHKTERVREQALLCRQAIRAGLRPTSKEVAALVHTSLYWREVVEPLTNEELLACIAIMAGDTSVGVSPVWEAFAKAKGICGVCEEPLSLYLKGEVRAVEWLDGRAYHSYCVAAQQTG